MNKNHKPLEEVARDIQSQDPTWESADIELATEEAAGHSPGGIWSIHASTNNDEKYISFVEYHENGRDEPTMMSDEVLGSFENLQQALERALQDWNDNLR